MNPNDSIHAFHHQYGNGNFEYSYGLTKREYIAALIMANIGERMSPVVAAEVSVARADALIARLSK